jgi:uncharacterized protein (DUF2252 family)
MRIQLPLLLAAATACSGSAAWDPPDKDDVRTGGKGDGSDWCEIYDWYGDGVCDPFCASPDPDCGSRADAVVAEIERANRAISAADRQLKYCKMAASPFVFYRGTAHLFYWDLANDARLDRYGGQPETRIWLQGDMHLDNAGVFDDDRGHLVYDLNDFDEAGVADYQLDLWRLAISYRLLAVELGLGPRVADDAVETAVEGYLDALEAFRGNDDEEDWQLDADSAGPLIAGLLDDVADSESRGELLDKYTEVVDGQRRFDLGYRKLADPGARADLIRARFADYPATAALDADPGYFAVKSIARRVGAGTGSLGTPRFYVLVEGATSAIDDDRILDVKRQGEPAVGPYQTADERALTDAAGTGARRVVRGHRALGNRVDDHLGWLALDDGSYSVRELSPFKESIDTDDLDDDDLIELAAEQATALAAAHARADRDFAGGPLTHSFEAEVSRRADHHHRDVRQLVGALAREYADLVAADHAAFLDQLAPACD